jgi:hypothetical protein
MAETFRFEAGGTENQRRMLYEQLNERNLFDPANVDRDRQLLDEFGPWEQYSAPVETVETAAPVSEGNQYIDWAMEGFAVEPTLTDEQLKGAPRIGIDYPDTDDDFLEVSDSLADKIGRPKRDERALMATEPGQDLDNIKMARPGDFPTPSEMQDAAGPINPNDRRSAFRKWLDDPGKEEGKTDDLIAAEEAKEAVELASAKPELDTKEDVKTVDTETEEKPEVIKTNYKDTDGYKLGKMELGPDPYAKRVEVYDNILEDLYTDLEIREDPVGDVEGSTEFFFGQEENYLSLASDIKEEIDAYEDSINAIAEEKPGEAISGANKFWAVIAAALGAGAASITGTPNFAMQIINKTIDDHLEKFKADRDFRVQSAERQQLNLINERGKMLQMAQNAANSAAASLKDRRDIQTQIATINNIKESTRMALEKNDQDFYLTMQANFLKQRQTDLDAKKAYGEKYVPGLQGVDSQGNPFIYSAAQGRTKKGVEDITKYVQITKHTLRELDKMDRILYKQKDNDSFETILKSKAAGNFNPAVFVPYSPLSADRTELIRIARRLELLYKEAYNLGANYSPREQFLVAGQIPVVDSEVGDIWLERITDKAAGFRGEILDTFQDNYETLTSGGMHNYGRGMVQKRGSNKSPQELGLKVRNDG